MHATQYRQQYLSPKLQTRTVCLLRCGYSSSYPGFQRKENHNTQWVTRALQLQQTKEWAPASQVKRRCCGPTLSLQYWNTQVSHLDSHQSKISYVIFIYWTFVLFLLFVDFARKIFILETINSVKTHMIISLQSLFHATFKYLCIFSSAQWPEHRCLQDLAIT